MTDEERRTKRNAYMRAWNKAHPGYRHKERMEAQREWRAKNPDKARASYRKNGRLYKARHPDRHYATNRLWQENNSEYKRMYHLWHYHKRQWGCTKEAFETIRPKLKGPCEICGAVRGKGVRMTIDHCHEKNVYRGVLCDACNHGIGNFRDDTERLRKAIVYLETRDGSPA